MRHRLQLMRTWTCQPQKLLIEPHRNPNIQSPTRGNRRPAKIASTGGSSAWGLKASSVDIADKFFAKPITQANAVTTHLVDRINRQNRIDRKQEIETHRVVQAAADIGGHGTNVHHVASFRIRHACIDVVTNLILRDYYRVSCDWADSKSRLKSAIKKTACRQPWGLPQQQKKKKQSQVPQYFHKIPPI